MASPRAPDLSDVRDCDLLREIIALHGCSTRHFQMTILTPFRQPRHTYRTVRRWLRGGEIDAETRTWLEGHYAMIRPAPPPTAP